VRKTHLDVSSVVDGLMYAEDTACLAVLGYADDKVLLAPTVRVMRVLLKICDDFAANYDVVFNASKSMCVVNKPSYGRNMTLERIPTTTFRIGGVEI
jgi:hypothetical protein